MAVVLSMFPASITAVESIERQLAGWQQEKRLLDDQLADPAFYAGQDAHRLREATRRLQALATLIGGAEARWLAAHAELEALGEA